MSSNRGACENNLAVKGKFRDGGSSVPQRLLVTGFGPFPGMARNPSTVVAEQVAASPRWKQMGIKPALLLLETSYAAIRRDLEPALRGPGIAAVLMIGVAGRSKHLRVERRAVNRANPFLPDATRRCPGPRLTSGPEHRVTAAETRRAIALLKRAGLPCRISQDAGRYLCNAAYFAALDQGIPVLFLHIPKRLRASRRRLAETVARQGWEARIGAAFIEIGMDLIRQGGPALRPKTSAVRSGVSGRFRCLSNF